MGWNYNNFAKPVKDLIRDKKNELTKQKDRVVSIEQTVEILLKDAYLKQDEKEAANG